MAKKKNEPSKWQSKIVGHGKVAASQLLANPFNHRRHPEKQRQVVAASIEELGFIKSVIVNQLTGHIVDGHERVMQALGVGDETLVDIEYVELSPEDEKKALLILDASSELAEIDSQSLQSLLVDVQTSNSELQNWFSELADTSNLVFEPEGENEIYTQKIGAPIYEPKGEKPPVKDLLDRSKADAMIAEINAADIPEPTKKFLRDAAERHVVFNFRDIAEFYCHADEPLQRLMERSGLVIIDFDKAIQHGFVHLTERLGKLADLEMEDDDESAG